MNVPNLLSVTRLILAPVFVIVAALGFWQEAFVIFCIAAFTDLVDGAIARLFHQQSILGIFLDPMADKLLMACSFITLSLVGRLPFWLTGVVFARDLMITVGVGYFYFKGLRLEYSPTILSKVTTLFQLLTLSSAMAPLGLDYFGVKPETTQLLTDALPYLIASTLIFTVITGVQYYEIGCKILKEQIKRA